MQDSRSLGPGFKYTDVQHADFMEINVIILNTAHVKTVLKCPLGFEHFFLNDLYSCISLTVMHFPLPTGCVLLVILLSLHESDLALI